MIKVIKKFGATWCAPCKALDKVLINVPPSITVKKYDVEEEIEAAEKYKITSVPTLVYEDADGNELDRTVGNISMAKITEIINKHA